MTPRLSDYEPLAKICSAFVHELFAPGSLSDGLPYFIAMALSLSQLPEAHALAALILLHRLKSQYPASSPAKGTDAARLFLVSYIVATKALSDFRPRPQFWVLVGQNKFSADEITQTEKGFLENIAWDLRIDDTTLAMYHVLVEKQKGVSRTNAVGNMSTYSPTVSSTPSVTVDFVTAANSMVKQSEDNLAALDQRIEELQQQYNNNTTRYFPVGPAVATRNLRDMLSTKSSDMLSTYD